MFQVTCYVQKGLGGLRNHRRRFGPNGHIEANRLGYFHTYAQAAGYVAEKCKDTNGNGHANEIRSI